MTTETMTIHKALMELKTIDDRINKVINMNFVVANKHSNQKYEGIPVKEQCELMKAGYAKVNDLIRRRNVIKRAVVLSNATTKVSINGVEYTVAEAIEMKNHGMDYKQRLLTRLEYSLGSAKSIINTMNGDKLETKADTYVTTLYGNSDMKNLAEDARKTRAEFITAQTYELLDPIGVESEIEKLREEISNFMTEVDSALSVSNALTLIEISY